MHDIVLLATAVNLVATLVRLLRTFAADTATARDAALTRLDHIHRRLRNGLDDAFIPLILGAVGTVLVSVADPFAAWMHSASIGLIAATVVHHLNHLRTRIVDDITAQRRHQLHGRFPQRGAVGAAHWASGFNSVPYARTGNASTDTPDTENRD